MQMLKNLDVWKKSSRLCVELYQSFSHCKDYGFKDQITRSSLSIPSNIAEGFERDSLKGRIQFLKIAKGSCGELWTQLLIAREIQYIDSEKCRKMEEEARAISKMLYGLIKHYQNQITSN